ETAAVGPAREREPRAGLRPGDVHLSRRVLRRGVRATRRGRPDHRQAPQRRRRQSDAHLPQGVPEVHELRRGALRAVSGEGPGETPRALDDELRSLEDGRAPELALSAAPRRSACALGICDGSGFVIDEESNVAADCRCRAGRIASARTSTLEGRIPRRYQGVGFDRPPVSDIARSAPDQIASVRRYVRRIEENLDRGRGLWLQGDVGTGKTTLAMLVSKAALAAGRSVA